MKLDDFSFRSQRGLGLLEAILGAGIACMIAMVMAQVMGNAFRANKSVQLHGELETIRSLVTQQLACNDILTNAPGGAINVTNLASKCTSTSDSNGQRGPYLKLYRATLTGSQEIGDFDSTTGKITVGNYRLRASCSESEQTLIIRAESIGNDPLTGKPLAFTAKRALLAGSKDKALPVCLGESDAKQALSLEYSGKYDPSAYPSTHRYGWRVRTSSPTSSTNGPCDETRLCIHSYPMPLYRQTLDGVSVGTTAPRALIAPTDGTYVVKIVMSARPEGKFEESGSCCSVASEGMFKVSSLLRGQTMYLTVSPWLGTADNSGAAVWYDTTTLAVKKGDKLENFNVYAAYQHATTTAYPLDELTLRGWIDINFVPR